VEGRGVGKDSWQKQKKERENRKARVLECCVSFLPYKKEKKKNLR